MKFRKVTSSLALLVALTASSRAEPNSFQIVRSARWFGIGGFGIAGTITREEIAFQSIRRSSRAREQFQKILTEGTVEGRMYALLGLKRLNTPDYETLTLPYQRSKVLVQRYSGCLRFTEPTYAVVQWINRYANLLTEVERRPNKAMLPPAGSPPPVRPKLADRGVTTLTSDFCPLTSDFMFAIGSGG